MPDDADELCVNKDGGTGECEIEYGIEGDCEIECGIEGDCEIEYGIEGVNHVPDWYWDPAARLDDCDEFERMVDGGIS